MASTDLRVPVLNVEGLRTYFPSRGGVVKAVDGVDLSIYPGEVLGLVGESGSGKSVTSLSILRLVDPPGEIVGGVVSIDGDDILSQSKRGMRRLRGRKAAMIFQQPRESLNPAYTIGHQVAESLRIHRRMGRREAHASAVSHLAQVGIPDPEDCANAYPHQVSGGQAQRVMIAMALSLGPKLLIADEPTTALDVTVQAQIITLLKKLRDETGMAVLLVTHDLGVIAEVADRVAVMYAGQLVEEADAVTLFDSPLHPYTRGLIGAMPSIQQVQERLESIPGHVPSLVDLTPGCRFADRCLAREENHLDICHVKQPDLLEVEPSHKVRCWLYQDH